MCFVEEYKILVQQKANYEIEVLQEITESELNRSNNNGHFLRFMSPTLLTKLHIRSNYRL